MIHYTKSVWTILSFLVMLIVSGYAVSVTVSTTGGTGDFNSIQYAIVSCLTNPDTPDVITILDNGPYFEALDIGTSGFDLTIQGNGVSRPVIVASLTSATTGPFGNRTNAIDLWVDVCTTVIKDIVLIPPVTNPAAKGIAIYPFSTLSGYTVALINVVVAGNDGTDQPVSMDGLNVVAAATTFTSQAIDLGSSSAPGHLSMEKVILSRATRGANASLRVLMDGTVSDRGSVYIGPGCVFSYNPADDGVYFGTSNYCDGTLSGTSTEPIIISNNGRYGIYDYNNVGNAAVNMLNWVIVTNNGNVGYRITGTSNPAMVTMTNCTFANNALSVSTAQIDFSVATATNIIANNVIFAGNDTLDATRANSIINGSGASSLTLNTCALALTGLGGATPTYALNTIVSANAVVGVGSFTQNGGINENPAFKSLDLTSSDFVAVRNIHYATAGPNGDPLTGAGRYIGDIDPIVPAELSRFESE